MTSSTFPSALDAPRTALRVGLGLAALLAGLDEFLGVLADWPGYLAPVIAGMLPVSPAVRDAEMAIAAFALARLTEARAAATAVQPAHFEAAA